VLGIPLHEALICKLKTQKKTNKRRIKGENVGEKKLQALYSMPRVAGGEIAAALCALDH